MDHNFRTVTHGFAEFNGVELEMDCTISDGGFSVASVTHGPMLGSESQIHEQSRANARRIAACINYCSGISTEKLEGSMS